MEEVYYIQSSKINAKVADTVIEGYHLEIDKITFQRLSRKPRGRSIKHKFINEKGTERLLIY